MAAQVYNFVSNLGKLRIQINVKVVSEESLSRFKICDAEREISLEVEGSKFSNSKFLREGKFVKIVDPKIDKENKSITINDQSLLIIGQPFLKVGH